MASPQPAEPRGASLGWRPAPTQAASKIRSARDDAPRGQKATLLRQIKSNQTPPASKSADKI
jgi:hypothetical protein